MTTSVHTAVRTAAPFASSFAASGAAAPVAFASAEYFANLARQERVGVILRRGEYTVQSILGAPERRRVVFMVRLDGGIGSEIVTIDQTLDASAALLRENDQVVATIVDDVHVESTVSPIFAHATVEQLVRSTTFSGTVLRSGEYLGVGNRPTVALLVLAEKTNGAQLVEVSVEASAAHQISAQDRVHVNILADGSAELV